MVDIVDRLQLRGEWMASKRKTKPRALRRRAQTMITERAPLVSVIIPTYNCAHFLGQAIESVLEQTFMDYEIIVVDDGSTDDTAAVLDQFRDQVRHVSQANQGNAGARNTGIAMARGQWLAFLDADDLWAPRKLERQLIDLISSPGARVGFVRALKFFESGDFEPMPADPAEGELWDKLVFYQPFGSSHSGMLAHQSCFGTVGRFDEDLRLSVDWDLFIRLAERYKIRVLQEFSVYHRQHASNTTGNAELRLSMYLACLRKHRRFFCMQRRMRRQWHESYGARLFRFGRYLLKHHRYAESAGLLIRSLRYGGRCGFAGKLKLLVECELRYAGLGVAVDWMIALRRSAPTL